MIALLVKLRSHISNFKAHCRQLTVLLGYYKLFEEHCYKQIRKICNEVLVRNSDINPI